MSEIKWLEYMNNKFILNNYLRHLVHHTKYTYAQPLVVGDDILHTLVDAHTLDLCDSSLKRKKGRGGYQNVYTKLSEYFAENKVDNSKVFLFGAVPTQMSDKYLFIHWNACIVKDNVAYWFDPASGRNHAGSFDSDIRQRLKKHMGLKTQDVYCNTRPQQILEGKDADIFCQTWVLMFTDKWARGERTLKAFLRARYEKIHSTTLRAWAKQLCKKCKEVEVLEDCEGFF